MKDENSVDVLQSCGDNLTGGTSTDLFSFAADGLGAVSLSKLTVAGTNMGNAQSATVYLWIR